MRMGRKAAAVLLVLLLLAGSAQAEKQIVLTFVGDCTVGCEDRLLSKDYSFASYVSQKGYAYFLSEVKDFLSEDDLTIANFEGVLKDNAFSAVNKTYCFRGLPEYAQILTLGSVEVVNLANNHTGDYGSIGRISTRKALDTEGLKAFGFDDTYLYEKDGITIAFCGFWGVGFNKRRNIADTIRQLKADGADAVVCTLHFGEEYATNHNNVQTIVAQMVIDAGADLVVGHHPHVVQGIEVYQNRMIFYSVGNFLFGGNATVRVNGCLIPRVTLTFSDEGEYLGQQASVYPGNISGDDEENDYQPRLVTGDAAQAVYERIDGDSAMENWPYQETESCRIYPYIEATSQTEESQSAE